MLGKDSAYINTYVYFFASLFCLSFGLKFLILLSFGRPTPLRNLTLKRAQKGCTLFSSFDDVPTRLFFFRSERISRRFCNSF